ncbi:hypothetical protein [Actinocatenispora comari]|jgi:hypothetical protein|uniref:Uncharacterized protein n=1 Tax=Actinocatenispora comari TaxID=2807577 RepID=A0A8J4EM42_9ACTN|nr:hypothetical protein [Actinocatenispora comari]GIL29166.1 hypothetical protein NUM_44200 [Actinocatenispora comari]
MRNKLSKAALVVGIAAATLGVAPVAASAAAQPMDPSCPTAPSIDKITDNGYAQIVLVRNCSYYSIKAHVGYSLSSGGGQIYTGCYSISADGSRNYTIPENAFGITASKC